MLVLFCALAWQAVAQTVYEPATVWRARIALARSDSARCAAYIHLANTYIEENKTDSSRWAAELARDLADQKKLLELKGWAEFLLGACYFYEGNYDRGIAVEQQVIQQAEQVGAPLLRANAQKMVAWMYTEMGKEVEALALFFEAMPVFKKYRRQDLQMNVGIGFYGIATCYFYLGHFSNAHAYYDSAIAADPPMDARELALALADRAAVVRDQEQHAKAALPDNLHALRLIRELALHLDAQAYVQAELALTYATLGDMTLAAKWADTAYELYQRTPFLKRYVSVYSALAKTYHLLGNYRQAFFIERETRALEDSIYKWRKLQVIEEMRVRYETDRMNREIELLNLQHAHQESVIIRDKYAMALLIGFVLLLIVLGYFFYRKREHYHRRIRELEGAGKVRAEKERISKDLHDSLGSQLSTISIGLQRAAQQTNHEPLQFIQAMTDNVTSELRDFIWANSQDSILVEELEQRINTLFWRYRKTDLRMELEVVTQEDIAKQRLSPEVGVHLYRIVQEAVQNAMKHSEAQRLVVQLTPQPAGLSLEIYDNGKGFRWPVETAGDHYGLLNMKRRATQAHGTFRIDTAPGRGTRIVVEVPVLAS